MKHRIALVAAAAALFASSTLTPRLGHVASSLTLVALSVLVAVCASGSAQALAVAAGALGAFGAGVLGPVSPAVAGAVLVGCAFAERTSRVRGNGARLAHVAVSLVGGALAGTLSASYATASLAVFVVAVAVASVLVALPMLIDADDALAHALEQAASLVTGASSRELRNGADLRRNSAEIPLDEPTAARVRSTWKSLLELADARVRLERVRPLVPALPAKALPAKTDDDTDASADGDAPASAPPPSAASQVLAMVDGRIRDHVAALSRAYTAIDTARAAVVGLDDRALREVESVGETLDETSRAIIEVR